MGKPPRFPIGIDDFRKLREAGLAYVDKTRLICDLLDRPGTKVVLLPRPRRFGKSLNLSMLRCWFEHRDEDLSRLFEGLSVWSAGAEYRAHFQKYPVIHLSFKGVRQDSFDACWAGIQHKISDLYDRHRSVLDSPRLSPLRAERFRAVLEGKADRALYDRALYDLSACLHDATGQQVIILIDEYDEPLHTATLRGFARPMLDFFRVFLSEGLKDNPHLSRAVLTGILRIARESIFCGPNNLAVYSLLRQDFSTAFGFTEAEVAALVAEAGRETDMETLRLWYNGYDFGGAVIYNPWSVLNFLADPTGDFAPHWRSTSSNELIRKALTARASLVRPAFEALLTGGSIERILDENVILDRVESDEDALWSLLVFAGYLRAEKLPVVPGEQPVHKLSIPNREVRLVYTSTFRDWLRACLTERGGTVERLVNALLEGDADALEEQLQTIADTLLSYHDPVGPEQLYHGLLLGLLATMEPAYRVRSNRESGKGRPDVMVIPRERGRPGAVLELKVARRGRRTPEQALEEGIRQIIDRSYQDEIEQAGAEPVHAFAVAFDGRRVWVRSAPPTPS
ncbi:MAG: AAA family ATPase [Polyangiaceae bacterium]